MSINKNTLYCMQEKTTQTFHVCVLNHFSRVRLFELPWTVAHQAPLSMGFSKARILEWVAMPSSRIKPLKQLILVRLTTPNVDEKPKYLQLSYNIEIAHKFTEPMIFCTYFPKLSEHIICKKLFQECP